MHKPPAEGSFCDEHEKGKIPVIVEDYTHHMLFVDKGYRIQSGKHGNEHFFFSLTSSVQLY
jgi:hypothetical protein